MKIDASLIRNCPLHGAHTGKSCPVCGSSGRVLEHTISKLSLRCQNCGQLIVSGCCPRCGTWTDKKVEITSKIGVRFVIWGQIMGGKNNIVVTRTGHRFPKPAWAKWRDSAVRSVREQTPKGWGPIDSPVNVRLDYFAGDKRRRDMPAIVDAIFHVIEKAGVVTDDWHLWVTESSRGYDKQTPRAVVTFL